MPFLSEIASSHTRTSLQQRRLPRISLRSLTYVKLDQANGGIIRDLTESGIGVQTIVPLRSGQEVRLRFNLLASRLRVETQGRVAWADANGQGGILFSALPRRTRHALKDWLLTQVLAAATLSGRDSIFSSAESQLTLSPPVHAAILVQPAGTNTLAVPVSWGIFSFSQRGFAMFVDTLVLACAILLFCTGSLAVMGGFPAWPLAAALCVSSSTILIAAYQLLFSDLLFRSTPGARLAALASRQPRAESVQRFR